MGAYWYGWLDSWRLWNKQGQKESRQMPSFEEGEKHEQVRKGCYCKEKEKTGEKPAVCCQYSRRKSN